MYFLHISSDGREVILFVSQVPFRPPEAGIDLRPLHREDQLLPLRVFRFGPLEDGNVGAGVFPEREKIFVGGERPDAGGIGIRALPLSLKSSCLQSIRTSYSQPRQRSRPAVPHDAAVIQNLLKLGGSPALSSCQIGLPAYIHMIETGNI